jgi:hypothetical protein
VKDRQVAGGLRWRGAPAPFIGFLQCNQLELLMESYAHQDLPRKRIKKLAAKFTDEEIRASLLESHEHRAFIMQDLGEPTLMFWNAFNGPMIRMDDDSVRAYAQLDFCLRHNYPRFNSIEELEAYVISHNWPRMNRG